jgi:hypothetical protein
VSLPRESLIDRFSCSSPQDSWAMRSITATFDPRSLTVSKMGGQLSQGLASCSGSRAWCLW